MSGPYRATLYTMVTVDRAETVARLLFPDEIAGGDCGANAPGKCHICAYRAEEWSARIDQVRAAMMEAFR